MRCYSRFDSNYDNSISKNALGQNFNSPVKGAEKFKEYEYRHNPDALRFTKIGRRALAKSVLASPMPLSGKEHKVTGTWKTSYQEVSEKLNDKVE